MLAVGVKPAPLPAEKIQVRRTLKNAHVEKSLRCSPSGTGVFICNLKVAVRTLRNVDFMKRQLAPSKSRSKKNKAAIFATFGAGCVGRCREFAQRLPKFSTMRAAQCDIYAWNQDAEGDAGHILSGWGMITGQ